MKLSVSLPDEDVEFLDALIRDRQAKSRSAGIQQALRLLRAVELTDAYAEAWQEWETSDEGEAAWSATTSDGI